jgi:hypothetical protein
MFEFIDARRTSISMKDFLPSVRFHGGAEFRHTDHVWVGLSAVITHRKSLNNNTHALPSPASGLPVIVTSVEAFAASATSEPLPQAGSTMPGGV